MDINCKLRVGNGVVSAFPIYVVQTKNHIPGNKMIDTVWYVVLTFCGCGGSLFHSFQGSFGTLGSDLHTYHTNAETSSNCGCEKNVEHSIQRPSKKEKSQATKRYHARTLTTPLPTLPMLPIPFPICLSMMKFYKVSPRLFETGRGL